MEVTNLSPRTSAYAVAMNHTRPHLELVRNDMGVADPTDLVDFWSGLLKGICSAIRRGLGAR